MSNTSDVKKHAGAAADLATQVVSDKKVREHLLRASDHAAEANRRVRSRFGRLAAYRQIALDQQLRSELAQVVEELRSAREAVETKRRHRLRNSALLLAGAGAGAIALSRSSRRRNQGPDIASGAAL